MTVAELLDRAERLGIGLIPDGDSLRLRAPRGTLTAEFRDELKKRKPELLEALRRSAPAEGVRIYSRHLDAELWIARDPSSRADLERELEAEGSAVPVLTADEAIHLGRMLEADARALFGAVVKIRRVLGGSLIRLSELRDVEAFDA